MKSYNVKIIKIKSKLYDLAKIVIKHLETIVNLNKHLFSKR